MSATPPIVVACTPWPCRVLDLNAASDTADALAVAGTRDGGPTGDCAMTGVDASCDSGAGDAAELGDTGDIATAEVPGAAVAGGAVAGVAVAA